MSQTTIRPEHAGITRVVNGSQALFASIWSGLSQKRLYQGLTGGAVIAAVTFASRALDAVSPSFWVEVFALSVVAFTAFALMIAIIVPALRTIARFAKSVDGSFATQRADETFWNTAQRDPRVMAELNAARARQSSCADEERISGPWYQLAKHW